MADADGVDHLPRRLGVLEPDIMRPDEFAHLPEVAPYLMVVVLG
jgi:hypothetical protein